jgi:hypothetical protein
VVDHVIAYYTDIEPTANTPLPPGRYVSAVYVGGTYRNLASRRKYKIEAIEAGDGPDAAPQVRYKYTGNSGAPVEETGPPWVLGVVKSVQSDGGVIEHRDLREVDNG